MQDSIKTRPELNRAALRTRTARLYRVYALAQHVNLEAGGQGDIALEDLQALVRDNGLFTVETLRRNLRDGDGQWWTLRGKRGSTRVHLHNRGTDKTACRLDTTLARRAAFIPLSAFSSLQAFKAALLASLFIFEEPRLMSMKTLSKVTGLSARTLYSYMHDLNFCTIQENRQETRRKELTPDLSARGYYFRWDGKNVTIYRRLPNGYMCDFELGAFGVARDRTRASRPRTGARAERTYYDNELMAAKQCMKRGEGATTYYRKRAGTTCTTWARLQNVDGVPVVC